MPASSEGVSTALDRVERARRTAWTATWFWFGGLGTVAAVILAAAVVREAGLIVATPGVVIAFVATRRVWRRNSSRALDLFRAEVMPAIVAQIDANLTHSPAGIPRSEFDTIGGWRKSHRYASRDLVQGRIRGIAVRFSLVHAEVIAPLMLLSIFDPHRTLFRGLFAIMKLDEPFTGNIQAHVGPKRVIATSSTIPAEALTPELCEHLLCLQAQYGALDLFVERDQVALALSSDYDLLDPDLSLPVDARQFDEIKARLEGIVAVVGELGARLQNHVRPFQK